MIKNEYMVFISPNRLNDIKVIADVYPSFPTDLQQIICSTLLSTNSKVIDLIYPKRISHIKELRKLNADINFFDNEIIIKPSNLENNKLNGIDLRGTFSLLVASGKINAITEIENVDNLFRGYCNIEQNLNNIGFDIKFI